MTNTLSQQLCELCGILPQFNCNIPEDKKCYGTLDCFECKHKKLTYINFEKPENFVRLFELKINKNETIAEFVSCHSCYSSNRKDFIKDLIFYMEEQPMEAIFIKQAIRETEWDWG